MTTLNLSPDARAIFDAAWSSSGDLGAILYTVADVVAPEMAGHRRGIRQKLRELAEELEDL